MHSIANPPTQSQSSAAQSPRSQRVLEYALAYLERGFSIVPVKPGKKIPAVPWAQYQERPATIGEVKTWFGPGGQFEGGNIALVTGRVSGVFAVDVDGPEGARVVDGLGLPDTAVSVTRRGRHYVFAYPEGGRGDLKNLVGTYPEVDGRADGGIIIVAPSLHPDGDHEYHWEDTLDASPSEAVAELEFAPPPGWVMDMFSAGKRHGSASVQGKPSAVEILRAPLVEGSRNDTLTSLVGTFASLPDMTYEKLLETVMPWSVGASVLGGGEPLPTEEVEAIVRSIWGAEQAKREKSRSVRQQRADSPAALPEDIRLAALHRLTVKAGLGLTWERVIKHERRPPEYEIVFSGGARAHVGGADVMLSRVRLERAIFAAVDVVPTWRPDEWRDIRDDLSAAIERVETFEATEAGIMDAWLRRYMEDRKMMDGEEWHERARGKQPFVKDGEYYLSMPDFESHITVVQHDRLQKGELAMKARALGWEPLGVSLPADENGKRMHLRVWRVPGGVEVNSDVAERDGF